MPVFDFTFDVQAPIEAIARFHRDTSALKALTMPPVIVQLHRVEPLGEGSVSEFTLWLGPLPLRWVARHRDVHPLHGFTDEQVSGPFLRWVHTHRFDALPNGGTRITEHIEYQHKVGLGGVFSRLVFSPFALNQLFKYRRGVTRRALE